MKALPKYSPKKQSAAACIILICLSAFLLMNRWYGIIDGYFILLDNEINPHITNFSISLILYLGIGYPCLLYGAKFRYIVIPGMALLAANFLCETLMAFLNNTDIVDAIFGAIGTLLGFIFLLLVDKYGLQKK